MARGFKRSHGEIRARLDASERAVLGDLFGEVHHLLEDQTTPEQDPLAAMVGISTSVDVPSDPALARLLPDGHRDDPEASAEFRRYTEQGLRERKRSGLATVRATLERDGALRLDQAEAQAWVVALTDVRLVLAERMGLRTDEDHDLLVAVVTQDDPDADDLEDDRLTDAERAARDGRERLAYMLSLYDFLAWLQETLVAALVATLPDPPR